jgi:hypothetical protein
MTCKSVAKIALLLTRISYTCCVRWSRMVRRSEGSFFSTGAKLSSESSPYFFNTGTLVGCDRPRFFDDENMRPTDGKQGSRSFRKAMMEAVRTIDELGLVILIMGSQELNSSARRRKRSLSNHKSERNV